MTTPARCSNAPAAIQVKTVGPDHAEAARVANNRARLEVLRGNPKAALDLSRKATDGLLKAAATSTSNDQGGQGCLVEDLSGFFVNRIAALAAVAGAKRTPALASEAFEMAQWANHSSAAAALQQMGLRFAAGTDALSALVRENQDLIAAARERDKALVAAISKPGGQQDASGIAQTRQALADIRSKLADVGARLEKQFPDFVALTNPEAACHQGRAGAARSGRSADPVDRGPMKRPSCSSSPARAPTGTRSRSRPSN